jgi:hypothetical protein
MPQPISATVTWDSTLNKGTVADISVPSANGATVIQWGCDSTVANFTITGLETVANFTITGLDASEFTPASSGTDVTTFTTTDRADTAGDYTYTVQATHALTGRRSSHDPKIINEP